tara:strand:+ start:502 stop:804 length:303 start_codon:yes stop_codon:yes gene_type:complete
VNFLSNLIFYGTKAVLIALTFFMLNYAFEITFIQLFVLYLAWLFLPELLFKTNNIPVYVCNLIFRKQNKQDMINLEKLKKQSDEMSKLKSEWDKYMEEFK